MANITSNGTGGGNSNVGSTWTGGSVPTSSDNAIIQNGDTVTQNAAHTFKSLRVESGGTWTADGSNHLTLSGENDSDFALQIVDGTYNHANGTVVINNGGGGIAHAAIQAGDATSTTGLYDLTISGGGTTCEIYGSTTIHRNMEAGGATTVLRGALTVNGNLAVEGTLNTQYSSTDRDVTVGGHISGNGTLTANTSTVTVTGQTTVATVNITTGTYNYFDDYRPTTSNITDNATFNQTSIGGQLGGRIIITASKTPTFNAVGRLHSTLDIQSGEQGNSTINLDLSEPQTGPSRALFFHNLELDSQNTENNTLTMAGAITCTGDLTLTDGTIDTSSSDHAFTVTGDVLLPSGGTLTGNSSTLTFGHITLNGGTLNAPDSSGSLIVTGPVKSGWLFNRTSGTFNHNNGLVHIQAGTNSGHIRIDCYDLKIEMTGSNRVLWRDQSGNEMTVANDLTIVQGGFDRNDLTDALTVTGDVKIEDGGKIGDQNGSGVETGANTFGSLTINSGGIYDATSGTTTITNQTGGGYAWYNAGGTFTHNDGLVKFTDNGSLYCQENTFYDLELNLTSVTLEFRWSDTSGNTLNILNDFTISSGRFKFNTAGDSIIVHGLTKLESTSQFGLNSPSGTHTFNGLVTLNGGTWFLSSGTNNMAGIRNVGGTIS